jgi:hypothetical protein
MKIENALLIGGAVFIAFWLYKRPKGVVNIDPKMSKVEDEKKTIFLNLTSEPNGFYDDFIRDYNASKERTVAPPMVKIDVTNEF